MQTRSGSIAPPFNIYSLGGMIFVEGLALVPSAFLILAPAARNLDPSLEESALTSGAGTGQLIFRIILPLMLPALAGTAIFLMIVSFVVFDVPGTIGMPSRIFVLSSQIYSLVADSPRGIPEYGKVSAMALMFTVGLLALTLLYHRLMRHAGRFATVTGRGYRPRPFRLGRLRYVAIAAVVPLFSLRRAGAAHDPGVDERDAVPGAGLVSPPPRWRRSPTTASSSPIRSSRRATINSIVVAVVASTAVAALSLVTAWVSIKSRAPGRRAIDALAFLPLAMPGVLIATALIYVYLAVKIIPIYGTIWIIAVAYLTIYLSFGSRTMNGVVLQLHPELDEAARMSGAGLLATVRRIIVPLAAPGLAAVWIWVVRPLPARAHRRADAAGRRQCHAADAALQLLVGRRDQQGRRRRRVAGHRPARRGHHLAAAARGSRRAAAAEQAEPTQARMILINKKAGVTP